MYFEIFFVGDWDCDGCVLVYFVKFGVELVCVVVDFGVEIYEYSIVCVIDGDGFGLIILVILNGCVIVDVVVFVINVFFLLFKCNWLMIVLVYDYVLMIELFLVE